MVAKKLVNPFQIGDKVVLCPSKTKSGARGTKGIITKVLSNLYVEVQWNAENLSFGKLSLRQLARVAVYDIRPEMECHNCKFRLTHLIGGSCSVSWKDVQTLVKVSIDGSQNTSSM